MISVGTVVNHPNRGQGVIVGYNRQQPIDPYFMSSRGIAQFGSGIGMGLVSTDSFYDSQTYPYIVRYDDGYKDVYSASEFTVVQPLGGN